MIDNALDAPTPNGTDPHLDYPEGADLVVRTAATDTAFWDRHPWVERHRLQIRDGHARDAEQVVLIWLKAAPTLTLPSAPEAAVPPDRPADLDLSFALAHDAALVADHPDVVASHADLQVNPQASGAERRLRLWLRTDA